MTTPSRADVMITPTAVSTAFFSLALLDCGVDGTASQLAASAIPRRLADFSTRELVHLAFALVVFDLPHAELLSFILQRISRRAQSLQPNEAHALGIVEHCVRLPEALCPETRADFSANEAARVRSTQALQQIIETCKDVVAPHFLTSSKLQKHLEKFFDQLQLPRKAEEPAGPYHLDFALPQQVAVEVDGFKHFYAYSRRHTAKSALKLRVLRALGWKVVSLPHFEWLPKNGEERLSYLAAQIEHISGVPLATIRKPQAGLRAPWLNHRNLLSNRPPACGQFQRGGRR